MGLFSRLFGSSSERERELRDHYVAMFEAAGMPPSEARDTVRSMIERAKDEAVDTPEDFGDRILAKESTDETVRSTLQKKRSEGVRDADIRWWWNMPDLERGMLAHADDVLRIAFFLAVQKEKKLNNEQAVKALNRRFPNYGDPDDASLLTGEDRALPWELKDRVNRYIEQRSGSDADEFMREVENSSSFNAWIRREIKAGRA